MSHKSMIRRLEHQRSPLSESNMEQLRKARRVLSRKGALAARIDRLLAKHGPSDGGFTFGTYDAQG